MSAHIQCHSFQGGLTRTCVTLLCIPFLCPTSSTRGSLAAHLSPRSVAGLGGARSRAWVSTVPHACSVSHPSPQALGMLTRSGRSLGARTFLPSPASSGGLGFRSWETEAPWKRLDQSNCRPRRGLGVA